MTDVINLKVWGAIRRQSAFISEVHRGAMDAIADILAADITKLNGRELRKLRDHLISLQLMAAVSSPEASRLIAQKLKELGRELTHDEVIECVGPMRGIKLTLA